MTMKRVLEVVALILLLGILRLIVHIPGIHPIGAIALFGGAMLSRKGLAFILPLAVLLIGDVFMGMTMGGFYSSYLGSTSMLMIYGAFIAMVAIGRYYIKGDSSIKRILIGSVASTLIFFVVSNLSAWIYDPVNLYPDTIEGAGMALNAGLPFLQYDALSIIGVTMLVFGVHSLYKKYLESKLIPEKVRK